MIPSRRAERPFLLLEKSLDEAKTRLDTIIASEKDRYKNSVLMEERNKIAREHRKATIRQLKELAKTEKGIT